jgi:hypothetical protein
VLQDLVEQDVHELEAVLRRLLPPIPNGEKSFLTSVVRHSGQTTPFSPPKRTSDSKR